jgi:hypothetical protein
MKRKDYKEVLPEPKDYGGVTIPMIVARARGRPPEEMIMICTFGKRWGSYSAWWGTRRESGAIAARSTIR